MFFKKLSYKRLKRCVPFFFRKMSIGVIGFVIGTAFFTVTLPSYQVVIPFDNVTVRENLTGPFNSSNTPSGNGYQVTLSYRHTACKYVRLSTMLEDPDGMKVQYPWYDLMIGPNSRAEPTFSQNSIGWHTSSVVVQIPPEIDTKNHAIVLMTEHICDDVDTDRYFVINQAIPGSLTRRRLTKEDDGLDDHSDTMVLTRVMARIDI